MVDRALFDQPPQPVGQHAAVHPQVPVRSQRIEHRRGQRTNAHLQAGAVRHQAGDQAGDAPLDLARLDIAQRPGAVLGLEHRHRRQFSRPFGTRHTRQMGAELGNHMPGLAGRFQHRSVRGGHEQPAIAAAAQRHQGHVAMRQASLVDPFRAAVGQRADVHRTLAGQPAGAAHAAIGAEQAAHGQIGGSAGKGHTQHEVQRLWQVGTAGQIGQQRHRLGRHVGAHHLVAWPQPARPVDLSHARAPGWQSGGRSPRAWPARPGLAGHARPHGPGTFPAPRRGRAGR